MKDAIGKDLTIGQRVAVSTNSNFKIGILHNYKANNSKSYILMVDYIANPTGDAMDWRRRYYTQEEADLKAFLYYVRLEDGKIRRVDRAQSIIGL